MASACAAGVVDETLTSWSKPIYMRRTVIGAELLGDQVIRVLELLQKGRGDGQEIYSCQGYDLSGLIAHIRVRYQI
jgi:hypothetical protein